MLHHSEAIDSSLGLLELQGHSGQRRPSGPNAHRGGLGVAGPEGRGGSGKDWRARNRERRSALAGDAVDAYAITPRSIARLS